MIIVISFNGCLAFYFQDILCGESEVVLTGGAENMSMAPYVVRGARFGIPLGADLKVCSKTIVC